MTSILIMIISNSKQYHLQGVLHNSSNNKQEMISKCKEAFWKDKVMVAGIQAHYLRDLLQVYLEGVV